jgi:hypothetical protein
VPFNLPSCVRFRPFRAVSGGLPATGCGHEAILTWLAMRFPRQGWIFRLLTQFPCNNSSPPAAIPMGLYMGRMGHTGRTMIAKRYLTLIRTIAECRVLSTGQFAALEFGSEQAARRSLRAMAGQKLVQVGYDRLGRRKGRPEQLISLLPMAVEALKESGALPKDMDPADALAASLEGMLDHQLMLNWVSIAIQDLLKTQSDFGAVFVSSTSPFRTAIPSALAGLNMVLPPNDDPDGKVTLCPDGILVLTHRPSRRTILFFIEVDMATEPMVSPSGKPNDIRRKLVNYRISLGRKLYKSCERIADAPLSGFRVLFIANTLERSAAMCRLVEEMSPMDFVWVTDHGRLQESGLGAAIWRRGGRAGVAPQSILGSIPSPATGTGRSVGI